MQVQKKENKRLKQKTTPAKRPHAFRRGSLPSKSATGASVSNTHPALHYVQPVSITKQLPVIKASEAKTEGTVHIK
eukprot:1161756-Pelagomonas_calceolata.AAC.6